MVPLISTSQGAFGTGRAPAEVAAPLLCSSAKLVRAWMPARHGP